MMPHDEWEAHGGFDDIDDDDLDYDGAALGDDDPDDWEEFAE